MFFGITQTYSTNIYGFYFEEYMLGYLVVVTEASQNMVCPWQLYNFQFCMKCASGLHSLQHCN